MLEIKDSVYETNLPIKYFLEEGKANKKYLLVVFSAFPRPNAKIPAPYNYLTTLHNLDCHKLFIADSYGPLGCYYLGEKMSFEVESSVVSLITYIARKLEVEWADIIMAGSSKGGSAAIYFGLKYNIGYVIAGAPQILIGDYVGKRKATESTAAHMLRESNYEQDIEHLNKIIYCQLRKNIYTKINILTSERDTQYAAHMAPFFEELQKNNIDFSAEINNAIQDHNEIGIYFHSYLIKNLTKIMFGFALDDLIFEINNDNKMLAKISLTAVDKEPDISVKYILKKQEQLIEETITNAREYVFDVAGIGVYQLSCELYLGNAKIYEKYLGSKIYGNNSFKLHNTEIEIRDAEINFSIALDELEDLRYAYYLIKDGEVIERVPYNPEKRVMFKVREPGAYEVMYFITTQRGEKISGKSQLISVN